jgi:hypothetical protein
MVSVRIACYDAVIMDAARTEKQMRSATEGGVRLLTVGHSNHEWPAFLELLQRAGVRTVVDVRSSPYSGRFPHFSRGALERGLPDNGLAYVFLGDQLGGRPASRWLYDDEGRVDYERVRRIEAFQGGLQTLLSGAFDPAMALLCSEEDPLDCHRGLMIAPALCERGFALGHLRRDGVIETNDEMESRLLRETGTGAGIVDGLFAAMLSAEERRELVAEAYCRRARRKAYRLQPGDEGE